MTTATQPTTTNLLAEATDLFIQFEHTVDALRVLLRAEEELEDDIVDAVRAVIEPRLDQLIIDASEWRDRAKDVP